MKLSSALRSGMVIVEEDREQPHVFLGGFDRGLRRPANVQRLAVVHLALPIQPDELRGLHGLRQLVLGHDEVRGLQVGDRVVVAIDDGDVDADEVHGRPEGRLARLRGLPWRRRGLGGRLLWSLGRRLLRRLPGGSADHDHERGCQDDGQRGAKTKGHLMLRRRDATGGCRAATSPFAQYASPATGGRRFVKGDVEVGCESGTDPPGTGASQRG